VYSNEPTGIISQSEEGFGTSSEFGFDNLLRFFGLLKNLPKLVKVEFGMRSFSAISGFTARKTCYNFATY